jgi:small conductance mechanosensitive channel
MMIVKGEEAGVAFFDNQFGESAVFMENIKRYFTDPAVWSHYLFILIKVAVIYVVGIVVIKTANKALSHIMQERDKRLVQINQRRTKTIGRLMGNVVNYVVKFIMFLLILNQFGFNLAPLLAGAGVVGLAVGFGAQSLVKDVITGFFIIFEDQFAVGDVIQTGKYQGTVEEIGLRITRIRSWTGEVHIVPNGTITDVTNYSLHNAIAVVDVAVPIEHRVEAARRMLMEAARKVKEEMEEVVGEPNVLGVQSIGKTEMTMRLVVECRPNTSQTVTRRLNEEIKSALERLVPER